MKAVINNYVILKLFMLAQEMQMEKHYELRLIDSSHSKSLIHIHQFRYTELMIERQDRIGEKTKVL